ncbi:hypothetical protein Cci01nite_53530 [Catellatospora citrea]|uniref:Uncharacterized protein n=2 Tax=Catellatospora citrea TaxID=53366 RepID=A0A8J3KGH4_9ACTN|nr:hypothetical protein C8E86_6856 [Catellatospora citrea]GIG00260.1 hypothetical protein Cci01nite_53530 [Catellatospora citrea]
MTALIPTDLPAAVPSRTYHDEPRTRRSIGLRLFVVLVVLGLGAAVVGFIRDLAAAPAAGPAVTVRPPDTLGGRAKTTDDTWARPGVDEAFADGATAVVLETYGTTLDENAVMAFAAAGAIRSPERAVTNLLLSVRKRGYTVMDFSQADPGPLGGVARCGRVSGKNGETAMCVWADYGSNGIIEWYFSSLDEARTEFPSLRAEIESRAS